jgi:hypothetical protein
MPARETEAAVEAAPDASAAAPAAGAVVPLTSLSPPGLLALQRSIGNAAVGRLLQRRVTMTTEGDVPAPAVTGSAAWTGPEVRAIQRELTRLRLYNLTVDGDLGQRTEVSLSEAFGNESWRTRTATEVTEALRAADTAWAGGGRSLRYAELFRDGVLDVTFGMGFLEGELSEMSGAVSGIATALESRGYTENGARAAELLAAAGRPLADGTVGRFYIKENAFTYAPPAGTSRPIHSIVRLISNQVPGGGGAAAAAFREAMTQGDAAWYSGHGRYGTGPDFDRNFLEFRLYNSAGTLEQTIDTYQALESVLRREGRDPWQVFLRRVDENRIQVDLSNAGNLRLAAPHDNEFGARLINWALERSGTPRQTGADGALASAASTSAQRYRVVAFYGCSTNSYDTALRDTQGFGTREADMLMTNRTTGGGADVSAFMSFLDNIVSQSSAERILRGVNAAMRHDEHGYSTDPWQFSGIRDNPGR